MANIKPEAEWQAFRLKVLHAAAKLFLEKGYSSATTREIAKAAEVNVSTMNRAMGSKENILCALVTYVLDGQFETAEKMLSGIPHDKILFYAAETTLQLYMAEADESIRNLYSAAYSMPNSAGIIQRTVTEKLMDIFGDHLPGLSRQDFYELEIASGGIMRSFMANPCDEGMTMDRKVERFLQTTFRVYMVPEEKIREAVAFVKQFDYPAIAKRTIDSMLNYLEEKAI